MKQLTIFLALALLSIKGFSQTPIKLEDVSKHVGDSVSVCGKVAGAIFLEDMEGSPTFLSLGAAYPDQLLSVMIPKDVRGQFSPVPEEAYQDKEVCVAGKIIVARDRPQIVIYKKAQITTK